MRVHFIIGRNRDEALIRIARRSTAMSRRSCGAGPRSVRGAVGGADPARGERPVRALSRRVPDRLSRDLSAAGGGHRYRPHRGAVGGAALGVDFYRSRAGGPQSARTEGVEPRPADAALGARAGARKHGLPRRRRAHLSHPAEGRRDRSGSTTWRSKARWGSDFDLAALKDRLEACFLVVMGKKAESDGYNAFVLASEFGWRDVALIRTLSRFLRQIRVPYSQDYMWATLRRHSGRSPRRSWHCSRRASIRIRGSRKTQRTKREAPDRSRDRNRPAGGRKPRRGSHPAPLRQRGWRRDPH